MKGHWRCKKHKESCRSYVVSIVEDLNSGKEVKKEYMDLVEWVSDK